MDVNNMFGKKPRVVRDMAINESGFVSFENLYFDEELRPYIRLSAEVTKSQNNSKYLLPIKRTIENEGEFFIDKKHLKNILLEANFRFTKAQLLAKGYAQVGYHGLTFEQDRSNGDLRKSDWASAKRLENIYGKLYE